MIGEVHLISDLPSYIAYWRNKFSQPEVVVTDYCRVMKTKMEGDEMEKDYFFLSDVHGEDKELRIHLQMKKLEHVLEVQVRHINIPKVAQYALSQHGKVWLLKPTKIRCVFRRRRRSDRNNNKNKVADLDTRFGRNRRKRKERMRHSRGVASSVGRFLKAATRSS